MDAPIESKQDLWEKPPNSLRLFLGGDVMTGRGIDQLFALHNPDDFGKPDYVSGQQYLSWSSLLHGPEVLPVRHDYIWGTALSILDTAQPDFRLVNLETSITASAAWEKKTYTFRMHPSNTACLNAAGLDCCVLANNHVLDFGMEGMHDTIGSLDSAGIGHTGAGSDIAEAERPFVKVLPGGKRILVFSWGFRDSGCGFAHWAADIKSPGINYLPDYSEASAKLMCRAIERYRRNGDLVVASLHWGRNRVQRIPPLHRAMARYLIDHADVDVIHGHSAHHVLEVEVYKGKPVLYGCGDLINDYEGKPENRQFRGYLGAMFFLDMDTGTHLLKSFHVRPVQRRRFRLELPLPEDVKRVLQSIGNLR